jgi:hypothetical protein
MNFRESPTFGRRSNAFLRATIRSESRWNSFVISTAQVDKPFRRQTKCRWKTVFATKFATLHCRDAATSVYFLAISMTEITSTLKSVDNLANVAVPKVTLA